MAWSPAWRKVGGITYVITQVPHFTRAVTPLPHPHPTLACSALSDQRRQAPPPPWQAGALSDQRRQALFRRQDTAGRPTRATCRFMELPNSPEEVGIVTTLQGGENSEFPGGAHTAGKWQSQAVGTPRPLPILTWALKAHRAQGGS